MTYIQLSQFVNLRQKATMKPVLVNKSRLQRACALLPVVLATHAGSASADAAKTGSLHEYSVVNLSPTEADSAVLNQQGQAAFVGYIRQVDSTGFFDGQGGLYLVGPYQNPVGYKRIWGLNNGGHVVTEADGDLDSPVGYRAYTWYLPGVVRGLTNGAALAHAINERNQIVGFITTPDGRARAHRWNADGTETDFGTPGSDSMAFAINGNGMSAGYIDDHAIAWDANGKAIELGLPKGSGAIGRFVNAQNQVAGTFQGDGTMGAFVWCRDSGLARIGPFPRLVRIMGFNDRGQVAGDRQVAEEGLSVTFAPFTWTAKRGLQLLPLGGGAHGRVDALNNRAEMVGFIQQVAFDDGSKRAIYWNDVSSPVDLNTRLYRAPEGLVLKAAIAINDGGTILANSNAGLVLLRPGRTGTAAPVLGPMAGADSVNFFGTLDFTTSFVDSNPAETHIASFNINDGCSSTTATLREVRGTGDVMLRHTFCRGGFFNVTITVTDAAGNATQALHRVLVPDGDVATLMGQGTLAAPVGNTASTLQAPPRITLWAPLGKRSGAAGATRPSNPVVNVTGPFQFKADSIGNAVVNGQSVQLSGSGQMNGRPGYRFDLDATPGNGQPGAPNHLHLRISHTDAATAAVIVDYDNRAGTARATAQSLVIASADSTLLAGGMLQLVQPQVTR